MGLTNRHKSLFNNMLQHPTPSPSPSRGGELVTTPLYHGDGDFDSRHSVGADAIHRVPTCPHDCIAPRIVEVISLPAPACRGGAGGGVGHSVKR